MKFWNFELFTSLPPLHLFLCFPSDAVDAERRGRRPRAAPSSRPQPFPRPWFLPKPLDLATRRRSLHARREWTPNRHDDVVPSRPTRASSSTLLSTLPFASQASSLPPPPLSFLLRAPARVSPGVQSRRRPPAPTDRPPQATSAPTETTGRCPRAPSPFSPNFPLAARAEPRGKRCRRPSPVLFPPPRTSREKKQKSRGLDAKVRFLFLLFSKTANL